MAARTGQPCGERSPPHDADPHRLDGGNWPTRRVWGPQPGNITIEATAGAAGAALSASLRRRVFVGELGAAPDRPDDPDDATATHLLARDGAGAVVGAVRVAPGCAYAAREFDLTRPLASGRTVAEIGRLCLAPDHRGGLAAMTLLRAALDQAIGVGATSLVGTGSFFGTEPSAHVPALRALRAAALAPPALRPVVRPGPCALATAGPADPTAMRGVPSLLKTYLRAGAWVGDGAWIDRSFGCVDVCLILDVARLRLPRDSRA